VSNLAQKHDYTADFLPFLVENWPGRGWKNVPKFAHFFLDKGNFLY
jgi:hypothetical protein